MASDLNTPTSARWGTRNAGRGQHAGCGRGHLQRDVGATRSLLRPRTRWAAMRTRKGDDMNERLLRFAGWGAGLVGALIAHLAVAQTPVVPKIPDLSASVQEHF